jgi:hypothetical protein
MSDARSAYIAGRSGGSRPKDTGGPPSTSSERQRTQDAYDAGKAERERAQRAAITKQQGVGAEGGLTSEELEQARNIASGKGLIDAGKTPAFKDPYDVLTREEEIAAGFPKTGIEKLAETTGIKIPNLTLQGLGLSAKALQGLLDKAFKPEAKDFSNPNFLAVLNAAFQSGRLDKDDYTEKYKELLDEVYGGQAKDPEMQTKLLEEGIAGLDTEGLFDLAMQQATEGVLPGSGTQRITDPASFYEETGMPVTSGDLLNLANLDAQQFLSGENYNPKLAQMIFDARAQLDSMGKNPFTGNPQGGGGGQGIVAAAPSQPIDIINPKLPGPIVPDPTQPNLIMPTPLKPVGVAGLGNYPSYFPFLYNNAYTNQGLPSAYSNILSKYYGFA